MDGWGNLAIGFVNNDETNRMQPAASAMMFTVAHTVLSLVTFPEWTRPCTTTTVKLCFLVKSSAKLCRDNDEQEDDDAVTCDDTPAVAPVLKATAGKRYVSWRVRGIGIVGHCQLHSAAPAYAEHSRYATRRCHSNLSISDGRLQKSNFDICLRDIGVSTVALLKAPVSHIAVRHCTCTTPTALPSFFMDAKHCSVGVNSVWFHDIQKLPLVSWS